MNVLLAIPLLLVPQVPPPAGEVPGGMISFEVRLVDCEAIGWREAYQTRLRFGGHRAGCSAWVADQETLKELDDRLCSASETKVVKAPSVVTTPGDPAIIGTSTTRHFVVHAEPEDAAGAEEADAMPRPVVAPVDDGSQIRLVGVPQPDGLLLQVEVIDTRVAAVHVLETPANAKAEADERASVRVQIPEVTHREMGGEWLLPSEHGLVLSLGVESSVGEDGEPAIRERLLLIASSPSSAAPAAGAPADPGVRQVVAIEEGQSSAPIPPVRMPAPVLPAPMAHEPAAAPLPPMAVPSLSVTAGPVPVAFAATPWGLLPILPVEVVPAAPAGVAGDAVAVAAAAAAEADAHGMPLPKLPSRTLPPAVGTDGRQVDPRTEKDRQAEQTQYTPYVDGQPVPSPQTTVPAPGDSADETQPEGVMVDATEPASVEELRKIAKEGAPSRRDASVVTVRFSINLAKGVSVDVGLGQKPEGPAEATADAAEAPVRK